MIFNEIVTDRSFLVVCGNLWPGAKDGAPPPDWVKHGGPLIHDHRSGAPECLACIHAKTGIDPRDRADDSQMQRP